MSTLPEQFSAASKSQIAAQLDFFESFGARAFDGAARLVALNIETGRAAVDNSSAALKELAAMRGPRDLFALTKSAPDFSSVMAYGSQWLSIVTDVQAGLLSVTAPVAAREAAPAPAPSAEAAPAAPPPRASEHHVPPIQPGIQPVVALEPEPAPEPVAEATPIAKAASKVAGKPASTKPVAATVAAEGGKQLPQVKPVEASPPPTVFDQDLLTPKRGKKR